MFIDLGQIWYWAIVKLVFGRVVLVVVAVVVLVVVVDLVVDVVIVVVVDVVLVVVVTIFKAIKEADTAWLSLAINEANSSLQT